MNKIFRLLSLLFLGITLLPACSKADVDDKDKPLIVVCEASTSPYCYYVGKDATPSVAGVDVDIVEEIAKELGRPVQYQIRTFQEVLRLVELGKADIGVASITITPQRAGRVLFSKEYDVSSQVIVVPKNSAIADGSMLQNARVAAQAGTSNLDYLRNNLDPEYILTFLTQEDINSALVENKADAAVMDRMQAELMVKTTGDTFKILEKPLSEDKYGLALNKQNTKLAETANKVIDRLRKDGAIEKSRSKHFDIVNQLGNGAQVEDQPEPFILCVESSFAPFVFWTDKNHLAGVDIEMAEAIAAELKRPLIIQIVPFIDVLPLVESGAADMGAAGITITPEREARVLFSTSYEEGGRKILVRDDATYQSIDELRGKRFGVMEGTTNEAFVEEELGAETIHYDNAAQGIMGLLNNEIDAYIDDEKQADLAADKFIEGVKPLGIALPQEPYGFAFHKGDDKVKAVADKIITEKRENGEIEKLFEKYNKLCKEIGSADF